MLLDWYEITKEALTNLLTKAGTIVINIVGAVIVFLIGWFVSWFIGKIISEVLKRVGFNKIFERESWKNAFDKAEIKIDAAEFVGTIAKWILIIAFLSASVQILGLIEFSALLKSILNYLPNVIAAAFIFVVASIISDILEKVIKSSFEGAKLGYGHLAGVIIKWAIWIFAFFVILEQLIPNRETFLILFQGIVQGIVFSIVITVGLAFGLGGKDIAADILKKIKNKLVK